MANLVTFGDSWCYGDELPEDTRPHKSFPALMAKSLGIDLENHAVPGNSIQGMIWDLLLWNDKGTDADLLLVGITSGGRMSWWRHQRPFWHSIWMEHGHQQHWPGFRAAHEVNRIWRAEIYHWHQDRLTYLTLLNNLSAIAKHRDIPLLVFEIYHGFERPDCMQYNFLIQDFALQKWLKEQGGSNFMPGGHPTEFGHQLIAQHLLTVVESRKLL